MRILLTGGRGFIGRHLAQELARTGDAVIVSDREDVDVVKGMDGVPTVDAVIHLGAIGGRAYGEINPAFTAEVNAIGTMNVARYCARTRTVMLYASSSEIYGDHGDEMVDEKTLPTLPSNIYGLSKRWGEEVARLYCPDAKIARISMCYGPGQTYGPGWCAITTFIANALRKKEITVHKGAMRCWSYVSDITRGLASVLRKGELGSTYNVGQDHEKTSMMEIAKIACELTGAQESIISEVDAPDGQIVVKHLSSSRLRELGWQPKVSVREGMKLTLEWMKGETDAASKYRDVHEEQGSRS